MLSRASEKPVTQTRSPGPGAEVSSDSTLIRRSAPSVVTKVRSALGSTMTTQMPVSRPSTGGADTPIPAAVECCADQVAVGPGAVAPACTHSAPNRAAARAR